MEEPSRTDRVRVFVDAEAVVCAALAELDAVAALSVRARGVFRLALTGGSSAKLLYPRLRGAALPFHATQIYWSDERFVPSGDVQRNDALARALWLDGSPFPEENIHAAPAASTRGAGDLDAAALRYEAELSPTPLDVVHLGLGPDGHVCSLFPGHARLTEKTRRVASIDDSPKPPPARITFTLRPLREARGVWFTVVGADKATLVREVLTNPTSQLPAALVTREAHTVWFLDEAAARALPRDLRWTR